MNPQPPELVDLWRSGLKGAADLIKVSLENAERLQNQQLNAIRAAFEAQLKLTAELGQAKTMEEVLAVQLGYWNGLYESQLAQARQWFSEESPRETNVVR